MKYYPPKDTTIPLDITQGQLKLDKSESEASYFFELNKASYDVDTLKKENPEYFNFEEFIEDVPQETSETETPEVSVEREIVIQENPETVSDKMLTRDIIVELRIKNGEGTSPDEFSTEFPYERL